MQCRDPSAFLGTITRECTEWGSRRCADAVTAAIRADSFACLLTPITGTEDGPPIARYVCPAATGRLVSQCEALVPGSTGTTGTTGTTRAANQGHMEAERNAAIAFGVAGLAAGAAGLRHAAKLKDYAEGRLAWSEYYRQQWDKERTERATFEQERNDLLEYMNPLPNKMRSHEQFAGDTFDRDAELALKEMFRNARDNYDKSPLIDKAKAAPDPAALTVAKAAPDPAPLTVAKAAPDPAPLTVANAKFKDDVLRAWDAKYPDRSQGRQRIEEHFAQTQTMARKALERTYGQVRPI